MKINYVNILLLRLQIYFASVLKDLVINISCLTSCFKGRVPISSRKDSFAVMSGEVSRRKISKKLQNIKVSSWEVNAISMIVLFASWPLFPLPSQSSIKSGQPQRYYTMLVLYAIRRDVCIK